MVAGYSRLQTKKDRGCACQWHRRFAREAGGVPLLRGKVLRSERKFVNIKIEHNVPIPHGAGNYGSIVRIFKKMKVGDSFVYPLQKRASLNSAARVGITISSRKISETKIRVWRIK